MGYGKIIYFDIFPAVKCVCAYGAPGAGVVVALYEIVLVWGAPKFHVVDGLGFGVDFPHYYGFHADF